MVMAAARADCNAVIVGATLIDCNCVAMAAGAVGGGAGCASGLAFFVIAPGTNHHSI